MRLHAAAAPDELVGVPRRRVLLRRARVASLVGARRAAWVIQPSAYPRPVPAADRRGGTLLHRQRVPLRRSGAGTDPVLEDGKRVNVALAAPSFDGVALSPGIVFSFWRTLGPPSARLGYRHGMEVRGGCVVPSIGGGLCLLSNAVFRAAAELGWDIVERHGHTMEAVASDDVPWGVDATVAWPYVDLRVAVPAGDPPARLHVRADDGALVVEVWGEAPARRRVELVGVDDQVTVVNGQRVRVNRVERRIIGADGNAIIATVATNAKRLLRPVDLGRSCLTCGIETCAGRVSVP